MQSATWEVIRAIFSDTFKQKRVNKKLVRALWAKYIAGETSYEQTFTSIVRATGGYQEPSWAKHGSDYGVATQEREGSTYRADVPRPQRFDIPKQQPRDGVLVGANVPRPDRQREFSPERFERRIKANEGNRGSQRDDAIRFARHQSATSIVDEHGYSQRDRRADDVGTGLLEGVKIKAVHEAGSGLVKAFALGGMKAPRTTDMLDRPGVDFLEIGLGMGLSMASTIDSDPHTHCLRLATLFHANRAGERRLSANSTLSERPAIGELSDAPLQGFPVGHIRRMAAWVPSLGSDGVTQRTPVVARVPSWRSAGRAVGPE